MKTSPAVKVLIVSCILSFVLRPMLLSAGNPLTISNPQPVIFFPAAINTLILHQIDDVINVKSLQKNGVIFVFNREKVEASIKHFCDNNIFQNYDEARKAIMGILSAN